MPEPYIPKVNDYVIWDKGEYGKEEVLALEKVLWWQCP